MSEFLNPNGETKLASVAALLQQLREQRDDEPAPSAMPIAGDFDAPSFKANVDSDAAREAHQQRIRMQLQEWEASSEEKRRNGRLFPPSSPEEAAMFDAVEIMVEEAKFKHELTTEWNAFPLLDWSQFLVMKLNEAKRERPMNFSTIRHLQNFLANA